MPVECLHALEGGLMKDCLSILYKEDLKPLWCKKLDAVVKKMPQWDKQKLMHAGTDSQMPRLLWMDGISRLEKINNIYFWWRGVG